jgi:hypothetical protein
MQQFRDPNRDLADRILNGWKMFDQLNKLRDHCHEEAVNNGWYDPAKPKRTPLEIIALWHEEAAEAGQELRNGHQWGDVYFTEDENGNLKPEGPAVEGIDLVIRVLDTLGEEGVDAAHLIQLKLAYNRTRGYRHGDKTL